MKKEKVIITPLLISTTRQVKLFQVKLPRQTKRIIGVEAGMRWIEGDPPPEPMPLPQWELPLMIRPSLLVGEVRLQSCDSAATFSTSEIRLNRNLDFGDFSSRHWPPAVYSHSGNLYEEEVHVAGVNPLIQGIYRDRLADQYNSKYQYIMQLYVWIEMKQSEDEE